MDYEIRTRDRQILAAKNETPAVKAGESKTANNREVSAIVAERAPCAGIVPRDFGRHLAALTEQQSGLDANHAANVREHRASLRSVAALLGAEVAGEVQL